jgi:hypothetical protein
MERMNNMNTNMDMSKKGHMDGPQLEFTLPMSEIMEVLQVGDVGKVMIPVEVTQVKEGMISFRKSGKAESPYEFSRASAADIRKSMPVAER